MLAENVSVGTPLPQDVAAERAVIASCLLRADGLHVVRELLAAEDFLVEPLADVFRSMVRSADSGKPVEMLLVRDQLEHDHALARLGGIAFLGDLLADGNYDTTSLLHYAAEVRERADRRRVPHIVAPCNTRQWRSGRSLIPEIRSSTLPLLLAGAWWRWSRGDSGRVIVLMVTPYRFGLVRVCLARGRRRVGRPGSIPSGPRVPTQEEVRRFLFGLREVVVSAPRQTPAVSEPAQGDDAG